LTTFWPTSGSPDYTKLLFEKIVAIPGDGAVWSDPEAERFTIEYDLETGQEVALCIPRRGVQDRTGSISRIPWTE
jgi:hypothetical protein